MEQITKILTDNIKIHPRNNEFFDDIEGKQYEQLKKSIEEDGIITPLIVAGDMTLLSGHQRLRVAKELGIKEVPIILRNDISNEDEKLKKLLATNFGRLKNNEEKQRRVAMEYVKLCGLKIGEKKGDENRLLTLEEIAQQLGTSKTTLKELLEIERKLTPEIKELLNTGVINKSTALKIFTKLSPEEQNEFLNQIGKDKLSSMTMKETQEELDKLRNENNTLKQQLKEKPKPEIIEKEVIKEVEVEKTPSDYETIKAHYKGLQKEYYEKVEELSTLRQQIKSMIELEPEEQYNKKLKNDAITYCTQVEMFISKVGGLAYLSDHINELPKNEKRAYIKATELVESWAYNIKVNIGKYL